MRGIVSGRPWYNHHRPIEIRTFWILCPVSRHSVAGCRSIFPLLAPEVIFSCILSLEYRVSVNAARRHIAFRTNVGYHRLPYHLRAFSPVCFCDVARPQPFTQRFVISSEQFGTPSVLEADVRYATRRSRHHCCPCQRTWRCWRQASRCRCSTSRKSLLNRKSRDIQAAPQEQYSFNATPE